MDKSGAPAGKIAVRTPSVLPIYGIGVCWVICALIFPLYKTGFIILSAVLSAAAYFVLRKLFPGKVEYVDAPTGDKDLDLLIKDGKEQLARIREADVRIKDKNVSDSIVRIAALGDKIFDNLTVQNKKSAGVRRFMNYYLPTVTKLLEHYAVLEEQGVSGENISSSMQAVESSLGMVETAFEKQLDNMFSDSALDITTDIEVLEQLMKGEGLAE